jgi:hypothetical protein
MTSGSRLIRHALRLAIGATILVSPTHAVAGQGIPQKLTDDEYWKLVTDVSEPGGFFRSDNFLSNEVTFQYIIPELQRRFQPGGVYLGVGPEQNFTYIVALRPKIAFIFDIRRQNMLQHLMYKSLMETSPTRAEFMSRLFSRARPAGLDTAISVDSLFAAFTMIEPDTTMFRRNYDGVLDHLVSKKHFRLTSEDSMTLAYVFEAFFAAGPDLNYSFRTGRPQFTRGRMPTYAELMVQDDGQGVKRSYLATEANYRVLRDMHMNNLIVPLVGDFAGPKAIRAVGEYLKARKATVSAFYLSNVEQYLFRQGDDWNRFFANSGALPLDDASVYIRAVFNGMGYYQPMPQGQLPFGPRSVTMLSPIRETVKAAGDGRVQSYMDVVAMSKP